MVLSNEQQVTSKLDKKPFISIVTVTYNAENVLEKTILSVLGQTDADFEYIIVDGQSNDRTIEVIEKYKDSISNWISEKDQGLYDAMNKGIDLAKGQYLWFLNAGDEIASSNVVEDLKKLTKGEEIIYSDTIVINNEGNKIGLLSELTHNNAPKDMTWKDMQRGMVVCHQSFIVKNTIIEKFDLNYKLSADIDWVIKCLKKSRSTFHYDQYLAKFLKGGISKKHLKASMKERYTILKKHFGFFKNLYNHFFLVFRYLTVGRKSKLNG